MYEHSLLKLTIDYRLVIPKPRLEQAGWVLEDRPVPGWLLGAGAGRWRLLSETQARHDAEWVSLKAKIDADAEDEPGSVIDFVDDSAAALPFRFFQIELTPPKPGWRFTFPRLLASIMGLRPDESSVLLLIIQKRIELWTLETMSRSFATPLREFL